MNGKILLISSDFFDSTKIILSEFKRRNLDFKYYDVRPAFSSFDKFLFQKSPVFHRRRMAEYVSKIIAENKSIPYSVLLLVNPFTFSEEEIGKLTRAFPQAHRILYLWDALDNYPNQKSFFSYFDEVYSFQKSDAEKYHLLYQPTYFDPTLLAAQLSKDFVDVDVSFLGSSYPNRYRLFKAMGSYLQNLGISTDFRLFFKSKGTYVFRKMTDRNYRDSKSSDFFYQPVSTEGKNQLLLHSKAVVDIPFEAQTGLSQRAIETLILGKKLITTNQAIKDYDLYDSDNVALITMNDFSTITREFLMRPSKTYSLDVLKEYSISAFLDRLLTFVS